MGVLKLFKMLVISSLVGIVAASPVVKASDASIEEGYCGACVQFYVLCDVFKLNEQTCHALKCSDSTCASCMGVCDTDASLTTKDLVAALENEARAVIEKLPKDCFFFCTYDGCMYTCNADDAVKQAAKTNGTLVIDSKDVKGTIQVTGRRYPPNPCYQCVPSMGYCFQVPNCCPARTTDHNDNCRLTCNKDNALCVEVCNTPTHTKPISKRDLTGTCHQQCDVDKCWIVCPPPGASLAEE